MTDGALYYQSDNKHSREFHKGTALELLVPAQTGGDHVDEIHKTQEEWNGAGTFSRVDHVESVASG